MNKFTEETSEPKKEQALYQAYRYLRQRAAWLRTQKNHGKKNKEANSSISSKSAT